MNPNDQANMMYYYGQNGAQGATAMQQGYGGQGQGMQGMTQSQQMQMAMMQQMAMQQQQQGMHPNMLAAMQQQQMAQMQHMAAMGNVGYDMGALQAAQQAVLQKAQQAQPAAPTAQPAVVSSPSNAAQLEVATVGIFLEEVAYFMEDMDHDLWWLLRMALQPAGPPAVVRGDEELQPLHPEVEAVVLKLKERADIHADAHQNQVRAKIIIIPSVDKAERQHLGSLRKLKFHCQGHIEVFPCMKEANNSAIWQGYMNSVSAMEPQWMIKSDGAGAKQVFARCAAIVPVYVDNKKKEIQLFNVWCKKRHWTFPEGDILRGADRNIYDTCRRQWKNQVGRFFGKSWSECFLAELPENANLELQSRSICSYIKLEQDGHRYPCRPHYFLQVTEDFYETTRCYEDASGVIKLPKPEGNFVNWDDLASSARRVHLEGVFFAVHDEARWVTLDYETGKIQADDSKGGLRKENADFLKLQPEKVWKWFADISGKDMVHRSSSLPDDFPEDGPFSVRMGGIDKTATDEDIENYFTERDVKVKGVEQFDVPRHTARVDFFDKASLEVALELSGHNLLRRKVKVELFTDAPDGPNAAVGAKPLKPYTGPLPDEGPFKVVCRGLDKTVTQRDLGYFFWDRDCECENVVYPLKNEKHAGTVEFKDQESLKKAMGLNSAIFKGREIQISLPTKEDNRPPVSRPSVGAGGGKGGGKGGKGGDRDVGRPFRDERPPPSRAEFGSDRPRLDLKPRSKPMPGEPGYREEESRSSGRSNPFGAAGPARDDRYKSTRADADDNWRR